jgi:WD40 repeat protein
MDVLLPSGNVILVGSDMKVYNIPSNNELFSYSLPVLAYRVKLLPDNVTVVLGMTDGSMRLINANTYALNSALTAHTGQVVLLVSAPDLVGLISGGLDNQLILWQWSTMALTQVQRLTVSSTLSSGALIATNFTSSKQFLSANLFV